ncbi:phytoene/squalene synthase family protein [Putridiphycobacter roseus]|uniref:Phytoene/squalene synthase family protein n=1 Tax=Putridiphycobacter roseus TaxID=2219161 RepID=A0A2W1NN16_9FLAO|nr:phytoene/squalene synthase family protein [Putridiphycobacter roseus]PZE17072.1 phytoene/squalene synthase family protein [Putridiphycobacter roseus]
MKHIYDSLSMNWSKELTKAYSTSFTLGIRLLNKDIQQDIYSLYGFVRLADEIVDTFMGEHQDRMFKNFKEDTYHALNDGISANPLLHSFQMTVAKNNIPIALIDKFLFSMEMDLNASLEYDKKLYDEYIVGSAEVVGLMCLKVFLQGDEKKYLELEENARALGSAFQKINFLRDFKEDYEGLGRVYFPAVNFQAFDNLQKSEIELDIENDFKKGYEGILKLPKKARFGVYMAYKYYYRLFKKIKSLDSAVILQERVRIPDNKKYALILSSYIKHSFNLL